MKKKTIHQLVTEELIAKYADSELEVEIPPPVFVLMGGKIIKYDKEQAYMEVLFPIEHIFINPFGSMQGGMIAAAVDNTFGPLSMLVGPLNYTRKLEIKYKRLVEKQIRDFTVRARCDKQNRKLFLTASVIDSNNNELATAKAMNWIVGHKSL